MAEDKAKLLKSLRIECSAEAPPAPRRRGWMGTAVLALAVIGAGGAFASYDAPSQSIFSRLTAPAQRSLVLALLLCGGLLGGALGAPLARDAARLSALEEVPPAPGAAAQKEE